jgi:hypothetical protein
MTNIKNTAILLNYASVPFCRMNKNQSCVLFGWICGTTGNISLINNIPKKADDNWQLCAASPPSLEPRLAKRGKKR